MIISVEKSFGGLARPHGLAKIKRLFGDIDRYIIRTEKGTRLDPAFEKRYICRVKLPSPLLVAGQPGTFALHVSCHELLAGKLGAAFNRISADGQYSYLKSYGGCFNFRRKRNERGLSTHCWGIAVDLNPETNLPGTKGDINLEIVRIFKESGFTWGGDWPGSRKDPMHFQYCTGY
jgi:hypothetical protein